MRGYVELSTSHVRNLCNQGYNNLVEKYENRKVTKECRFSILKMKKVCREYYNTPFCCSDYDWSLRNINKMIDMCDDVEADNQSENLIWLNHRVYGELLNLNNNVLAFNPCWFGKEY